MSTQVICDGCRASLFRTEAAISGRRADGTKGLAPLPDDTFDWCTNCALVAFAAVRDNNDKRKR